MSISHARGKENRWDEIFTVCYTVISTELESQVEFEICMFPEFIVLHSALGCKSVIKTEVGLNVWLYICGELTLMVHQVPTKPLCYSPSSKGQGEKIQ